MQYGVHQSYVREINMYSSLIDPHVLPVFCFDAPTMSYATSCLDGTSQRVPHRFGQKVPTACCRSMAESASRVLRRLF